MQANEALQALLDESAVRRLIAKFANSLDAKAWGELGECLSESIYTDYSALRGTPPESVGRADFVAARREALAHLTTHHMIGNNEVFINGTSATARLSATVYRRDADAQVFRSHCMFLFGLQSPHGTWSICSIVQKILWTEGNAGIHGESLGEALLPK